ncbi:hypothetical protein OsJ_10225 [Oryza sativa Japonica Group]|nr:hypothetical protein OsJ_10225 [Oryza sativa Japonica Group]
MAATASCGVQGFEVACSLRDPAPASTAVASIGVCHRASVGDDVLRDLIPASTVGLRDLRPCAACVACDSARSSLGVDGHGGRLRWR